MKLPEYWIVRGAVTDNIDAWPGTKLGQTEWQISNGLPGKRSSSADYLDLAEGIKEHAPAIFHFVD